MHCRIFCWIALIFHTVQAWCAFEHVLVTTLATSYMQEDSVKVLDAILQSCPWQQAYPTMNDVASASVWADVIRHEQKNTLLPPKNGFWHYTNVPFECHPEESEPQLVLSDLPMLERLTAPGNPYDGEENAAYILEHTIEEWKHPKSMWQLNVFR